MPIFFLNYNFMYKKIFGRILLKVSKISKNFEENHMWQRCIVPTFQYITIYIRSKITCFSYCGIHDSQTQNKWWPYG